MQTIVIEVDGRKFGSVGSIFGLEKYGPNMTLQFKPHHRGTMYGMYEWV